MIEIERLTKTFGSLQAVKGLSLTIPRGELFCFLGPNGAGKTTTIKILCGLLKPTGGTIRIRGINIQTDPAAVRRLIGYIPDTPFLYERLTPVEFFQFIGDLYQVPSGRVEAARARQHQRRGCANAVLNNKQIEETCRLDDEGQRLLEQAIDRLGFSARAYHRILKVARTIADMAAEETIRPAHVAEAIQYRCLDRRSRSL